MSDDKRPEAIADADLDEATGGALAEQDLGLRARRKLGHKTTNNDGDGYMLGLSNGSIRDGK
ncbi:MAG: hypothetical protein AAF354_12955 [Pseudomonadota bacterium]